MEDLEKFEELKEIIFNLDENNKIMLLNEYFENICYYDEMLYYMNEFDELMYNKKPSEIARSIASDFDWHDDYFYFDCYGVHSVNHIDDYFSIYIDDITDYILEEKTTFDIVEIENFIKYLENLEG